MRRVELDRDEIPVAWEYSGNTPDLIVWARCAPGHWNGFALPYFDRKNADEIVNLCNSGPGFDAFEWDGNVLVQTPRDDDYGPDRIQPVVDDQGVWRWPIGAGSWTWCPLPRCPHCGKAIP